MKHLWHDVTIPKISCICFKKNNVNTSYNSYDCSSVKSFDTWIDLRLFYSVIIKRITLYRGSHKLMQLFMRRKRGRGIEQYSWFYIPRHFLEFAAKYTFCFSFDTRHPRVHKHTAYQKVFCSCQKGEIRRVHGRNDRAWIETINL